MTPERRAEYVEALNERSVMRFELENIDALTAANAALMAELLTAELAAKDKALDQAIELCDIQIVGTSVGVPGLGLLTDKTPELAAELRKREGQ